MTNEFEKKKYADWSGDTLKIEKMFADWSAELGEPLEKQFKKDYNKCVEIMNRFDDEFLKSKESTRFAEKLLDKLIAKHHFTLKEVKDNKFPKCDKFDQAIKNYVLIGRIKKK
jgi:hypothetical protein|tara:strand:+ start:1549 stop:1887 length:339 start_codon:yes stop_codon:yes gene_type:complete